MDGWWVIGRGATVLYAIELRISNVFNQGLFHDYFRGKLNLCLL